MMEIWKNTFYAPIYTALSLLHSEHVSIKPKSSWSREIKGFGVIRIAANFDRECTSVRPMVLDGEGQEWRANEYNAQPIGKNWSSSIRIGANETKYIVMRNEGDEEVSFHMLAYPE